MKILLIILLAFNISILCQDRIDPQPILDSLTVNDSIFSATENQFIKAWNWSSQSNKLDDALGIDFNHTGTSSFLLNNSGMYRNNPPSI